MIKVLHLSKYYPPYQGGIETFLFDLNESINTEYHGEVKSDILAYNDSKETKEDSDKNYRVHRSGKLFSVASMPVSLDYIRWLRKNKSSYDIIHIHYPNPFADLAVLLSGFRGKIVIHWHSDIVKQKVLKLVYNPLQMWLLRRADAIISTSQPYADSSELLLKFKDKVSVIPLGINSARVGKADAHIVSKLKESFKGKKVIFSLGRQVYYKGYEYLIKAASHLPKEYIILIGGKGELYNFHEKLIEELALGDKVTLLGFVSDDMLSAYYEVCDLYVMSSIEKSEAFGVVQVEAMSFGKPLVSTSIPGSGVGWVNKNGISGIVVPPKDAKALSEAIILVSQNHVKYEKGASERYKNMFKINVVTQRVKFLYDSIL